MFCLTCLASYCPSHLEPHYSVPVLKKHQLVLATTPLQEKICEKHNKLMELYCRKEKMCICYLCFVEEHKMHSVVSAATERAKEQVEVKVESTYFSEHLSPVDQNVTDVMENAKWFSMERFLSVQQFRFRKS